MVAHIACSVWRPLKHSVEDWPLAVCDGSTVDDSLLVAVDYVRSNYVGETLKVLYSPNLRWHYLSQQTKDEVFLFKQYDSSLEVKAKCEYMRHLTVDGTVLTLNRLCTHVFQACRCTNWCFSEREHRSTSSNIRYSC
jgi:hypothetical protein